MKDAKDISFEFPKMPTLKTTKSGYEIRADLIGIAKDLVQAEYNVKFQGWQMSAQRDERTGQLVTVVEMPPFPGLEQVLDTAQRLYDFVSADGKK